MSQLSVGFRTPRYKMRPGQRGMKRKRGGGGGGEGHRKKERNKHDFKMKKYKRNNYVIQEKVIPTALPVLRTRVATYGYHSYE